VKEQRQLHVLHYIEKIWVCFVWGFKPGFFFVVVFICLVFCIGYIFCVVWVVGYILCVYIFGVFVLFGGCVTY